MKIWIDGDACPNNIKEVLFRAANRTKIQTILVANHFVSLPPSPYISRQIVEQGFDVADNTIVDQVEKGDIVITADIPLANDVLEKSAHAINPRGELYSAENIKHILAMRNFNESLRETGQLTNSGPAKLSNQDTQKFSNQLDKLLSRTHR
jgi:uncharacterized protein YaiI (UPF0178 family)